MLVTTSELSVSKHGRQFKQIVRERKQMEQLKAAGAMRHFTVIESL